MNKHDTARRTARTFLQAFLGSLLILLPTDLMPDASIYLEALAAAAYAAVIATITFLHNGLENSGKVPDTRTPSQR